MHIYIYIYIYAPGILDKKFCFYFSCRKTQKKFDDCVLEKLGQERPEVGYFSRVRVHDSKRPRPEINIPLPERVPDPIDHTTVPAPDSVKYGTRIFGKTS